MPAGLKFGPCVLNSLIYASPRTRGQFFPLDRHATSIGSAVTSVIRVDAHCAEPRHAELRIDGPFVVLTDLSLRHGTYVNGQRVKNLVLANRDLIEIGDCLFRFLSVDQQMVDIDEAHAMFAEEPLPKFRQTKNLQPVPPPATPRVVQYSQIHRRAR